ncbi:MAG: hypothetical protein H6683_06240 [Deltaproteobacteria bacterium]|nr:hypothetical protein [Deltaproteobacteria bacterium]
MSDIVKVAAIQQRVTGDRDKDVERAKERVAFAAQKGAALAVFPELFGWPWFPADMDPKAFGMAQTLEGEWIHAMRDVAKEHGIAVAAPLFLHDGQGTYFNAVVAIEAGGQVVGDYRAVHLPQIPGWEGKFYFAGGEDYPVMHLAGMPVGFAICWDAFFPEAFRILTLKGARAICVLSSATGAGEDLWTRALTAQAFFNGVYIVRVNRVGTEGEVTFTGGSFAAAPTGDLLGDPMGEVEGVALYDIDRRAVEMTRREFPFLKDRQPRTYFDLPNLRILTKEDPGQG